MKTKSSAKKRFTVLASGKIKRSSAKRRHLLECKRTQVKRHLRAPALIAKADVKAVRAMLPYG